MMDLKYTDLSYSSTSTLDDEHTMFQSSDLYPDPENRLLNSPLFDLNFMDVPFDRPDSGTDDFGLYFGGPDGDSFEPSPTWSEAEKYAASATTDSESSDPVLKYISQMLMEENMEDKPSMWYDPMALKETEKSLYDALGERVPSSLNSPSNYVDLESPDSSNLSGNGSVYGANSCSNASSLSTTSNSSSITSAGGTSGNNGLVDPRLVLDVREVNPVSSQTSAHNDEHIKSNSPATSQILPTVGNGNMSSPAGGVVQNMISDTDSVLQFKRGLEEASKFLPSVNQLVVDIDSNLLAGGKKEKAPIMVAEEERVERPRSSNESRGRKNHSREDSDVGQERNSKQSSVYVEENEICEAFDRVLLWPNLKGKNLSCGLEVKPDGASKTTEETEQPNGSNGGKTRTKKQGKKKGTVDLRNLLILCAQAVSGNDFRTANELLKQIRQHASPLGDGSQRLAHCFANGLFARLGGCGNGAQGFYACLASKKMTAADILKSYQTHLNACPFKKLSIVFANKMILRAAEKATTLHIVDFGVLYGFQWPLLIQLLSMREGGPPKLRITGIELPQQGFRPAERIEETGRRLARYCDLFNVPFDYNPVAAQRWESITIEDLKIRSNEVLAVNCLARFKNLLEETAGVDCPRNAVLGLIRKIKPDIFVHCIINGSYNAPFFATRFREALFHFTSLFDMFDTTVSREDEGRMMLENEIYGREAMNVVACEGMERVERPETYKQWQIRMTRAGFKQLPLDKEVTQACRNKLSCYHKDFVICEDNNWMLQGWKGRIMYASTCWVPA